MLTAILDVLSRYLPLLLLPVMAFATEKLQHRRIAALTGQLYNLTECSLSQKFDLWVDQICVQRSMFNIGVHKLRTQFFINFHANNSDENPCLVWKGFKTASGQVLLLTALVERSRFWPISGCSGRGRHISAWKQTLTQHRSSPSSECPAVFLLF